MLWPPNCDSCQISISGLEVSAMASSPSPSSSATASGSSANSTFFCHGCKHRIPNVTQDFTCPRPGCNSGFVEEMSVSEARENQAREHPARGEFHHADPGARFFEQLIGSVIMDSFPPQPQLGQPRRAGGASHGIHFQGVPAGAGFGAQPFLQDLLHNLAGIQGDDGHHIQFIPGGFQMYSNPGDYAWGRGGLDAIVTQLLNQMDGAGPPPMQKGDIDSIPSIQVTQQNADDKVQCSVCWEDFVVGETVRKLNCDHIFHSACIVPWLELHSTCPVCRKSQSQGGEGEGGGELQAEPTPMDVSEPPQSAGSAGAEQQSYHPSFGNAVSSVFDFLGSAGPASQHQQPSTSSSSTSASGAAEAPSSSASRRANDAERAPREAPDRHESYKDLDLE